MPSIQSLRAFTTTVATSLLLVPHASTAANYAATVLDYHPGAGIPADYQNLTSILGEPSRETLGDFGGPVDPFSAPWKPTQLLSLGAGGSLTLRFLGPVFDLPGNPFGLDFSIFGSSAFVITNGDYTGGGITDGTLFGDNPGHSRVSVSQDGISYYLLDPSQAPVVDGLFPTDGPGDFTRPVDPSLRSPDFAGLNLEQIRAKYAGSAGGTGYDLAWAIDDEGQPVALGQIEYLRVEVISGRADLDALSAVPEPGVLSLVSLGAGLWLTGQARSRRATPAEPSSARRP